MEFERDDIRRTPYLDTELMLQAIEEFSSLNIKAITLVGGGEPLLHKNIEKIISAIDASPMEYGVITNLSIEKTPHFLSKATWIRVSVDAGTEKTYDIIHRPPPGSFSHVLSNIKALSPLVDIGICFLVHRDNWTEILTSAKLFKESGARYIQFKPVYEEDRGKNIEPFIGEINTLLDEASSLADSNYEVINLIKRLDNLSGKKRDFSKCRVQDYAVQLGVDGKIYVCCLMKYIPGFCLGDLKSQTFKEIWNSENRKSFLKNHNAQNCPPCWYDTANEVLEYMETADPANMNFI